jgi:Uncharacterized protein conserved in bacteria (DUF2059)
VARVETASPSLHPGYLLVDNRFRLAIAVVFTDDDGLRIFAAEAAPVAHVGSGISSSDEEKSMQKMTCIVAGLLLVLFSAQLSPPALGDTADTNPNRQAAALRYVKAVDTRKMLNSIAMQMATLLPKDKQSEFLGYIKNMNIDRFEAIMVSAFVQHFTAEELAALADFYGSKNGQEILRKMPAAMGTALPAIQVMMRDLVNQYRQTH